MNLNSYSKIKYNGQYLDYITIDGTIVWTNSKGKASLHFCDAAGEIINTRQVYKGKAYTQQYGDFPKINDDKFSGWFVKNEAYDFDSVVDQPVMLLAKTLETKRNKINFTAPENVKSVNELSIVGKTVFLRIDLNLDETSGESDILAELLLHLPTINYVFEHGCAKLIISSSTPSGQSFLPVARCLQTLIEKNVGFVYDVYSNYIPMRNDMANGDVLFLENMMSDYIRADEKACSNALANMLACDIFINDAPDDRAKNYADIVGIARFSSLKAIGYAWNNYTDVHKICDNPIRPMTAVIGGGLSENMAVLNYLIDKVDQLIVTGKAANTFLTAEGYHLGTSVYEPDMLSYAKEFTDLANNRGATLQFPVDFKVAGSYADPYQYKNMLLNEIDDSHVIVDIGKTTVNQIYESLSKANTILIVDKFGAWLDGATLSVLQSVANSAIGKTVVALGHAAELANKLGIINCFSASASNSNALLSNDSPALDALTV